MAILLFAVSAIFAIYVLFGYPLLLGVLSRRRAQPVRKAPLRKSVSVILPVRNGGRWLKQKLESVLALDYPRDLMEIIVVSDGSEDETDEIAQAYAHAEGILFFRIPRSGKPAALNKGIEHARGEILFFTDVRQPLARESLRELVSCFADARVGAVSGELVILDGESHEEKNVGLYWKYEKWIRKRLSRIDSIPGATGCIYAMRRSLAGPIPEDSLLDDVYQPLRAFFAGYRVILDPAAKAFDYPTALESEFRRKVRTLAGVYQVMGHFPALLGPRNRMWLHFISHKAGRLLLPWALIVLFASSFGLPAPWATLAVAGQATFYGLAVLDLWIPRTWALKRITSPVRTFVILMGASAFAVSFFFVPRRQLWKETRVSSARQT